MKVILVYSNLLFLCILSMGFLLSCGDASVQKESKKLARVGDSYLTIEEARQSIPPAIYQEDSVYALDQYRQQWIRQKLVLKQAQNTDVNQKKAIQKKLKQAQYEVLREALRRYIISSEVDSTISDQEARRYFKANKQHFALEEPYVQYRHLTTPNIKDARAAKRELRNDGSWEVIAANYAQNPNQAIQESKKYYPLSTALKSVDIMHQYLQGLATNQVSAIQRVNGIYHFVQLLDRRDKGESPDFNWLKQEIKKWIILDKRQRKFSSYLKNLYLKAQSDNEIETYNVLSTKSNSNNSTEDTLESPSNHE